MQNVQYESEDSESVGKNQEYLSGDEEQLKMHETPYKPNVIQNESSEDDYQADEPEIQQINTCKTPIATPIKSKPLHSFTSNRDSDLTVHHPPAELEEIVKMFAHDLQQSIRQRFKSKAQSQKNVTNKKIPFDI